MSQCPVCASEANDELECQNCGRRFTGDSTVSAMRVEPLEGLEVTGHFDSPVGIRRSFKSSGANQSAGRCRSCGVVAVYDNRCRQCGERQSENSGDND